MHPTDIDPHKLYPLAEAARLIPSPRPGVSTRPKTLRRWHQEKRIKLVARPAGKLKFWFVFGSELLRFLSADERPEWRGRTPGKRARDVEAAKRKARQLGLQV